MTKQGKKCYKQGKKCYKQGKKCHTESDKVYIVIGTDENRIFSK